MEADDLGTYVVKFRGAGQGRKVLVATIRVAASPDRLRALDSAVDVDGIRPAAGALERTCAGEGPAGETSLGQRFRWLTAPRSTVVHAGPVHGGLTVDPETEVERLLDAMVR